MLGCGIAGLSAAVSAAEARASVRVVERASRAERGGNTRWTSGNLRTASLSEPTDDMAELPHQRQRPRGWSTRMAMPSPGLVAAGETVGLYYAEHAGGTSYLRGPVLGRLAGRYAARRTAPPAAR